MSLQDSVTEKAIGGAGRLLLAPVFLLFEITGSLLPGITLVVLVALKRNPEFVQVFDRMPFGYKTKIACGLLMCFVIGKVLAVPGRLINQQFFRKLVENMKKNPEVMKEHLLDIAAGVFILPSLFGRSEALTYMALIGADASFFLNTGVALMIAAAVPGDGIFRLVELGAALPLVWIGYATFSQAPKAILALLGMSLSGEIEKLIPGGLLGIAPMVFDLLRSKPTQPESLPPGKGSSETSTDPAKLPPT